MKKEKENVVTEVDDDPKTLWNKNFIAILFVGFLSGTANQMVNPLLSKYVLSLGATLTMAGTIVGLQSGIAMFLRPISGAASDTLNRKYVMMAASTVTGIAFTGYFLFGSIQSVLVCRVLQGVSFAFMSVARTTYATEFMPKDRIGEGVAFTSFGVVLSQAAGPSIGLWLQETWGYHVCFIVAIVCSFGGAVLLFFQHYKPKKKAFDKTRIQLQNLISVEVIPYALISGMFSQITSLSNSFIALIGDARGIVGVGMFFTTFSISALILRPASGKVLDKMGLDVLIYPAFFFASVTMVLLGTAQSLLFVILAGLTKALSQGIALPSIHGASIKRLGKEKAGVSSATIHMGSDFMNSLSPTIGATVASAVGFDYMYYVYAIAIPLIGIPAYWLIRRSEKKRDLARGVL